MASKWSKHFPIFAPPAFFDRDFMDYLRLYRDTFAQKEDRMAGIKFQSIQDDEGDERSDISDWILR
ncbi:hypothetical protein V1478_012381 [Vespula squamosa]|uniref:Uncharacterized protein n=1 Tax=Vespula squamosa TaxID=30214 RepID=A0ABD2AFP2_VESSQ